MPYIGCTQKLAKELKPAHVSDVSIQNGLRGWHGNILRIYRRKSVLLVNDASRFALFVPGLVKRDFVNFNQVFLNHFEATLRHIGANDAQVAQAKLQLGPFSYGKTHSRSVLGSMNDMKFGIEYILKDRYGRLPETIEETLWMTSFINETPHRGKDLAGHVFPDREIFKVIEGSV